MPQAASQFPHLARHRPFPSPNDCQFFLTKLCVRRREGREERERKAERRVAGHTGMCGPSVSRSHILPERGKQERHPGLRFPATLSVCFCSKKKPHTPPPHSSHTLTHTHSRRSHTQAPKGKPLLAFPPRRQFCLGPLAERERGGRGCG